MKKSIQEIRPLSEEASLSHNGIEEIEARLEAQGILAESAGIWQCNPIHLCDWHCVGPLCEILCPCHVHV